MLRLRRRRDWEVAGAEDLAATRGDGIAAPRRRRAGARRRRRARAAAGGAGRRGATRARRTRSASRSRDHDAQAAAAIHRLIARDRFVQSLGIRCIDAGAGHAAVALTVGERAPQLQRHLSRRRDLRAGRHGVRARVELARPDRRRHRRAHHLPRRGAGGRHAVGDGDRGRRARASCGVYRVDLARGDGTLSLELHRHRLRRRRVPTSPGPGDDSQSRGARGDVAARVGRRETRRGETATAFSRRCRTRARSCARDSRPRPSPSAAAPDGTSDR